MSCACSGLKRVLCLGGGHSLYILVGACRSTSKKGVLGTGTGLKRGVLRTGTNLKMGGLKNWSCKKGNLTDVAQKGVLEAYLLSIGGGLLRQTKNRGLRHGSGQERGVLGTGQARKKGGLRHGSGQKRGVFTVTHTCTGHICECPPPPPREVLRFVDHHFWVFTRQFHSALKNAIPHLCNKNTLLIHPFHEHPPPSHTPTAQGLSCGIQNIF